MVMTPLIFPKLKKGQKMSFRVPKNREGFSLSHLHVAYMFNHSRL